MSNVLVNLVIILYITEGTWAECETNKTLLIGRLWWPLRGPLRSLQLQQTQTAFTCLLRRGVLGHSFGALWHGVLGQLTGKQKPDGGLDFPGGDGGTPVVVGESAGLGGDALEDVVHEGVHDGHGLWADASVGVHLLEHLVDVDGVGLSPPPPLLLVSGTLGLCLGGGLLGSLACSLGWHVWTLVIKWGGKPHRPLFIVFGVLILQANSIQDGGRSGAACKIRTPKTINSGRCTFSGSFLILTPSCSHLGNNHVWPW